MFSRIREPWSPTAAWRLSLRPTLAFAVGTAVAFVIMYFIAARSIREHNDAWLNGEAEVLRQVSLALPRGPLYPRVFRAIAESATKEVTGASRTEFERAEMIFFLCTDATGKDMIWLGPDAKATFIGSLRDAQLPADVPQSVAIPGRRLPFRVVVHRAADGSAIYLGLSDIHAVRLMDTLVWRLAWVWFGVVCAGWVISFGGARRTLRRVESITEAAARIRSDDLGSRIPEGTHTDEIARLARTLNGMLDRVAASVSQLRSLADAVAHELKSPLASIRGRLEIALSSSQESRWREAAVLAIEDLDRLAGFITTTLDVAEADGGGLRIRREAIDLTALVSNLLALYEPAFSERQQRLDIDLAEHAIVHVDTSLITRALANLLDNELNHARPGTSVTVRMTIETGTISFQIHDDGAGFPVDVEGRVFQRFARDARSTGHGLGLAFVRAIVVAHRGSVAAGNRPDGGAFVRLTLPTIA